MNIRRFFVIAFILFTITFSKDAVKAANLIATNTDGTITWTLYDDGELNITGSGSVPTDPSYKNYKSVIKRVTIESGITAIEREAFSGYTNLERITIPNTVNRIETGAFMDCSNLQQVTIPNGVTKIEPVTFEHCKNLKSVGIPNTVTEISNWAFTQCEELQQVTLPSSLQIIGISAFQSCPKIRSITIPDTVTTIGNTAFGWCLRLETVSISSTLLSSIDPDSIFNSTKWWLKRHAPLSGSIGNVLYEIDANGNATVYGNGAFQYDTYSSAFGGYSHLIESLTFSSGITSIEFSYGSGDDFRVLEKIVNNSNTRFKPPQYTNYSWCKSNDLTEPIFYATKGTFVKIQGNLTHHYKITFDGNGATSGSMNMIVAEVDSTITLPKNMFSRNHYIFEYWEYMTRYGNTSFVNDCGSFNYSSYDAEELDELVFKAKWRSASIYKVYFYSTNEYNNENFIEVYEGESLILPECQYSAPNGKKFVGWNIDNKTYKPGDSITVNSYLYAYTVWEDKTLEESRLQPNEKATDSSGITVKASLDAKSVTVTATKNKKSIKISSKVNINGIKYPVTELGKRAISGKKVEKVTINAKYLKKVNKDAFKGAKNLNTLIIKGVKKGSRIAKKIEKAARKANKNIKIIYK